MTTEPLTTEPLTVGPAAPRWEASPPVGRVARLAAEAADAAQVRALTTHPDVIALRVEKGRTQVDALLWAGIVLGLAFTMVNVQSFAAAGATPADAAWWVAWLLDPMVSLVLLAVLRAEQVTARYQVQLSAWARRTKWLTFAATYVMNTWTSWGLDGGVLSWSGVVLHSVPPLIVFATAETGPGLRDKLTEAVHRALAEHAARESAATTAAGSFDVNLAPREPVDPAADHGLDSAADHVAGDLAELTEATATVYEQGTLDEHGLSLAWADAPPASPTTAAATESTVGAESRLASESEPVDEEARAAALIAAGVGRRRLARELAITEYEARQLLEGARARTPSRTAAARTRSTSQGVQVLARPGGAS